MAIELRGFDDLKDDLVNMAYALDQGPARLGRIEYSTQAELESFLKTGQGNVTVKLSLSSGTTAINSSNGNLLEKGAYYTLNGVKVENPSKGLFIKDGKKVIL